MHKQLRGKIAGNGGAEYHPRNDPNMLEGIQDFDIRQFRSESRKISCLDLYRGNVGFFTEYITSEMLEKIYVQGAHLKRSLIECAQSQGVRSVRLRSESYAIEIRVLISDDETDSYEGSFTWPRFCACVAYHCIIHDIKVPSPSLTANLDKGAHGTKVSDLMDKMSIPGCHFLYNMIQQSLQNSPEPLAFVAGMCVLMDYSGFIRSGDFNDEAPTVEDWIKAFPLLEPIQKVNTRSLIRQNDRAVESFSDPVMKRLLDTKVEKKSLHSVKLEKDFAAMALINLKDSKRPSPYSIPTTRGDANMGSSGSGIPERRYESYDPLARNPDGSFVWKESSSVPRDDSRGGYGEASSMDLFRSAQDKGGPEGVGGLRPGTKDPMSQFLNQSQKQGGRGGDARDDIGPASDQRIGNALRSAFSGLTGSSGANNPDGLS